MKYFLNSRTAIVAGLLVASLGAHAGYIDQQVEIMKANDNRTLTVRYTGAKASLIELRINGASVATRAVSDAKTSGESNFTLETANLIDGENKVEIRLLDEAGRILGSEKTTVVMNRTGSGPVFLNKPQSGATVEGLTEISVGFKSTIKGAYVSFFVNDEFKALKNYAPYTYLWDTNTVSNGWHEVEAWVVDEGSTTFRTERMRVFVNNPNGRTERQGSTGVEPRENVAKTTVALAVKPNTTKAAAPVVFALTDNKFNPVTSKAGVKPAPTESGLMTGHRVMRPTGQRVAAGKVSAETISIKTSTKPAVKVENKAATKTVQKAELVALNTAVKPNKPVKPSNNLKKVTTGTVLPNIGYYPIYVNGTAVNFDVKPRVTGGVALTPFRHLFEHVGGKVDWKSRVKSVEAKGLGQNIAFTIGQDFAIVNGDRFGFERASFLEAGRSIVPLSFVQQLLGVNIQFDASTKHMLVTKSK